MDREGKQAISGNVIVAVGEESGTNATNSFHAGAFHALIERFTCAHLAGKIILAKMIIHILLFQYAIDTRMNAYT